MAEKVIQDVLMRLPVADCFDLFQGANSNAEGTSPTNPLAGDDDARSKILGLRRGSLYTDGLDLVRSLHVAVPTV